MIRVWLEPDECGWVDECCEFAERNEWLSVLLARREEVDERLLRECELEDQGVIAHTSGERAVPNQPKDAVRGRGRAEGGGIAL